MQRTDKEMLLADIQLYMYDFFEKNEIDYLCNLIEKDIEQNG
jgi:hypothetical protein